MFTRTVQDKVENFSIYIYIYIYLQLSRPQTSPNDRALNLNSSITVHNHCSHQKNKIKNKKGNAL